jgi:hypothetical protein
MRSVVLMASCLCAVLGVAGCERGACYYDTECIGCGPNVSTITVRYCFNGSYEADCKDDYRQSNSEWVGGECCSEDLCDTVLNPEDCASE